MAAPSPSRTDDTRRGRPAPPDLVARRRATASTLAALPLAEEVTVDESVLNGVPVLTAVPDGGAGTTMLYLHGGGYRLGSAPAFRSYTSHLARHAAVRVVSVDYRLAPEHPFPAALDDAVAAYTGVLNEVAPERLVIGGDSAGGGLAAALLGRLSTAGPAMPAAVVLLSPWTDLRLTAASYAANGPTDAMFSLAAATEAAEMYLAGHPATDPLVSPVLADWSGRPPLLVHCSAAEVLRDDGRLVAEVAAAAGVRVRLEEYPGMAHVWHLGAPAGLPEALRALTDVGTFIRTTTGRPTDHMADPA